MTSRLSVWWSHLRFVATRPGYCIPEVFKLDPGTTDDNITDTEEANNNRTLAEGEGETEVDDWFDDKVEVEDSSSDDGDKDTIEGGDEGDEEAGGVQVKVQRRQKKKKGEGLPALIEAMRKHPRPVGGNLKKPNVSLVAKVPPIPAPKGKKPRGMYVFTSVPMSQVTR